MLSNNLRRAALAAAVAATFAPAGAQTASAQVGVPCVQGVTCTTPAPQCANADLMPARSNLAKIERSTLCLLNVQRTRHHLGKLHLSRPLRAVARKYARQMVVQRFFDHTTPTGVNFVQRIERSSYLSGVRGGWALGENLAWGEGTLATPREIVKAWMHSPGHRRNILDGSYHDAGLGVALGVPLAGGANAPGATYANEFGKRS